MNNKKIKIKKKRKKEKSPILTVWGAGGKWLASQACVPCMPCPGPLRRSRCAAGQSQMWLGVLLVMELLPSMCEPWIQSPHPRSEGAKALSPVRRKENVQELGPQV
jgi:hypothetical protein